MPKAIFKTERLYFRELLPEDAHSLYLLHSNSEVLKYVGMPVWTNLQDAIDYTLVCAAHYRKHGYGRWGVYQNNTDEFIGLGGLLYRPEEDYIDLGYRFFPEHWGYGFATEVVKGILNYAFNELNIEHIIGYADAENVVSQRVMVKAGMRDSGWGVCIGLPARKFEIAASAYFGVQSA
jgi:[ribosomal protein S5]-alanine N-acetyltransferase